MNKEQEFLKTVREGGESAVDAVQVYLEIHIPTWIYVNTKSPAKQGHYCCRKLIQGEFYYFGMQWNGFSWLNLEADLTFEWLNECAKD